MIDFNFQFSEDNALKSAGQTALFRVGMQTAKPFKDEDFNLKSLSAYENRPWLTSLMIKYGKQEFIFSEVIISISQDRNIVTTPLQGRDGTIKEFISNGDYNISIAAGVIENDKENSDAAEYFKTPAKAYPEGALKRLREILTAHNSIEVQSDFLNIFDIKTAVVKSFSLTQETHSNRQSIQIEMLSDKPYEIKAIKEDYVKVK